MEAHDRRHGGGASSAPGEEYEGWWFCPPCGALHDAPACPVDRESDEVSGSPLESALRLCACCSRVPIRHTGPLSSFFCEDCGAWIAKIDRRAGRLVVPMCADRRTNAALVLSSDCELDEREVERVTPVFARQLERLAEYAAEHARDLHRKIRLPRDGLVPLGEYVRRTAELRADGYQSPAAVRDLHDCFVEYVVGVPERDPALAARIDERARIHADTVDVDAARSLLASGVTAVHGAAQKWAWDVVREVFATPSYLPPTNFRVAELRGYTILALEAAFTRELERAYGPAKRPPAPHKPSDLRIVLAEKPGEVWPEGVPERYPADAETVVAWGNAPPAHPSPLRTYYLSADAAHGRWILWFELEDPAPYDEDDALTASMPVAWCANERLSARDAAFLLLEALLDRGREAVGEGHTRPRVEFGELFSEDLAEVLLDQIWPCGEG